MVGGYMGKILFVDLSTGTIRVDAPDEQLFRDFIGGYGVGARIIYSEQKAGADPLGPQNMLGFTTGPLTGTNFPSGARFTVVAGRSPLTKGWGDANAGGDFGPTLKAAGYDCVFFTGAADRPVYLLIEGGRAELRDASHLWGKGISATDDALRAEHGKQISVAAIGPAGENISLISCIMNDGGAAAGRSGLGAVMGSKKLKAVAVRGSETVPIARKEENDHLHKELMAEMRAVKNVLAPFRKYGTSGHAAESAHDGDTPVKNWGGIGIVDFPDTSGLEGDAVIANLWKPDACWRCPLSCQALLKEGTGEYKYPKGTARPEYETLASFGTMCLNNNTESIAMANRLCNDYGLDTISAGTTVAFAMECYENGIVTKEDTDGIVLTWGNHQAIVAMTEKMAKREGFGDVLADGVKVAAEKIGRGAEQYAIHIGGQEPGMHDPKLDAPMWEPAAARFQMDATPGRHTQGFGPKGFRRHVVNAAGICVFYAMSMPGRRLVDAMRTVTGLDRSMAELLKAGERIANMRHVVNLREGINPLGWEVHPRIVGKPPQEVGPLAGITADIEAQVNWNLGAMDWDRFTTKPSKGKLLDLGLDDVAGDLWSSD
jgi:aldehyde:ferredoxin oxidoreductase